MGGIFFFFFFFFVFDMFLVVLGLLVISLSLSMFMVNSFSSWLGALFFLIYMGAVLVMMYYMFSLASNNSLNVKFKLKKMFALFMMMFFIVLFSKDTFSGLEMFESSKSFFLMNDKMFSFFDGFMVYFALILLIVLWVSSKFQMFKNLALRLFF